MEPVVRDEVQIGREGGQAWNGGRLAARQPLRFEALEELSERQGIFGEHLDNHPPAGSIDGERASLAGVILEEIRLAIDTWEPRLPEHPIQTHLRHRGQGGQQGIFGQAGA